MLKPPAHRRSHQPCTHAHKCIAHMQVQLAAAGAIGVSSLLASVTAFPLLGLPPPALLSAESAFILFLVCSAAGADCAMLDVLLGL